MCVDARIALKVSCQNQATQSDQSIHPTHNTHAALFGAADFNRRGTTAGGVNAIELLPTFPTVPRPTWIGLAGFDESIKQNQAKADRHLFDQSIDRFSRVAPVSAAFDPID
jgi:hypothetical protein